MILDLCCLLSLWPGVIVTKWLSQINANIICYKETVNKSVISVIINIYYFIITILYYYYYNTLLSLEQF